MNWNLEGLAVEGFYLDDIPVKGRVRVSRVKYGGEVCHHVELFEDLNFSHGLITRDAGGVVIVDHKNITRVMENNDED